MRAGLWVLAALGGPFAIFGWGCHGDGVTTQSTSIPLSGCLLNTIPSPEIGKSFACA